MSHSKLSISAMTRFRPRIMVVALLSALASSQSGDIAAQEATAPRPAVAPTLAPQPMGDPARPVQRRESMPGTPAARAAAGANPSTSPPQPPAAMRGMPPDSRGPVTTGVRREGEANGPVPPGMMGLPGPGAPATSPTAAPPAPAPATAAPPSALPNPQMPPTANPAAPPKIAPAAPTQGADGSRVYPGTNNFVNTSPPPATPAAALEETFTLNFEATDIRGIVQSILGDYLRESFTVHPQTTGTATIRTSRPVPRSDLIPILEMLLRQNGQIMLREGGMYKILPAASGVRGGITPQVAGTSTLPNGYSVQIVQMKFVGAKDMQRILEPYAADPPATSVRIDEPRNLVILSGTQRELKHLLEIIDLFDVDFLAGYSIGLFPMQADVKSLTADLDRLFGAAAGASPLAGIVRIIPIERMNGLLVISTQARYLEEARKWIERLDKAGGLSGGMRVNVYHVQHGKAEKLAQLLSEIYGNRSGGGTSLPSIAPGQRPASTSTTPATPGGRTTATPTPTPTPTPLQQLAAFAVQASGLGVSQNTRIIADNDNNSLLILSSAADYETIKIALKQLDVPRRQVKVEVLVAEVTLTDDLQFGLEWFVNSRGDTVGSLRNSTSALPNVPATGGVDPRTLVSKQGSGLQLINVLNGDIRGVLQALGKDGRSQVLSTPNLTVLDNEKGTINVGTKISINTGTTSGNVNTVTTNQYVDTGVLLTVTPRINAGGRVTLDINQEVSSAGVRDSPESNPPIDTRKATTVVNVGSGDTIVLGGLIQNSNSSNSAGVPLLSKIPILGGLFGSQGYKRVRTELVILITPVVISNSDDAKAATDELRKKLPLLESYLPKSQATAKTETSEAVSTTK